VRAALALSMALACACAAPAQTPPPTGGISGAIQAPDGKGIASVVVWIAARSAAPGAAFTAYTTAVQTARDGSFRAIAVPDGNYSVCPVPPDGLLSPCLWDTEPIAAVSGGGETRFPALKLKKGVDLFVRVNDPRGMRAAEGKVPGANLLLGVSMAARRPIHIPLAAGDKAGADYRLTVPPDIPLVFIAHGRAYEMDNGNARLVDRQKGLMKPITIPANSTHYQEVINIH
jgi:hypothetical protein